MPIVLGVGKGPARPYLLTEELWKLCKSTKKHVQLLWDAIVNEAISCVGATLAVALGGHKTRPYKTRKHEIVRHRRVCL